MFVKLNLVLGEPQKGTTLTSELAESDSVVLEICHEEGELITQTKERSHCSLVGARRKIR